MAEDPSLNQSAVEPRFGGGGGGGRGWEIEEKILAQSREEENDEEEEKTRGKRETRPIAISRVLRAISDRRTDRRSDRATKKQEVRNHKSQ